MIAISPVSIGGIGVAVLVVLILLVMLRNMINIVQQGEVGVVKRLGEYRKTHDPGLVIIAPFIDGLQRVDMREIPVPGDRQEVITQRQCRRHRQRHDLHPDRRRQAGAVQRRELRCRDRRAGPHRPPIGDRHPVARRGAVGARADQHRRPVADGSGHRQVGHPDRPYRDRRDHATPKILEALALQKQADQEKRGQDPPVGGFAAIGDQHRRRRGEGLDPLPPRASARPRSCEPRATARRSSSRPKAALRRSRASIGRSPRPTPTRH